MSVFRILAVLSLLSGIACLQAAGLSSDAVAVECNPVLHSPAKCEPAHEEQNTNGSTNLSCHRNYYGTCVPSPGSECGTLHNWGRAVAGKCKLEPASSNTHECQQDAMPTIVTLHEWTSACIPGGSDCTCYVFVDPQGDTENVEVCECTDEPA